MRLAERARQPTVVTDVYIVLTLALGAWAAALIVLTALAIAHPTYYGFAKAGIKAIGATVVALIAISQAYTMEARLGHLPRGSLRVKYLLRAHRWGGRIALVMAALIAIFCLTDIGARGGRKPRFDHAAAPWYSWRSPPSRSRRRTSRGSTGQEIRATASGGASSTRS